MQVDEIIEYTHTRFGVLLDKRGCIRAGSLHNNELGIGVPAFYILLNDLVWIVTGKDYIFDIQSIWDDTRKFPKEVNCPLTP